MSKLEEIKAIVEATLRDPGADGEGDYYSGRDSIANDIKEVLDKEDDLPPRFGKVDLMNDKIYVFYTAEDPEPVAMYVGAQGEYDAFYDFAYNYCGSPLTDIVGRITYDEFMENVAEGLVEHGWSFINIVADDIHQVTQIGVTIEEVFDKAHEYLAAANYWTLPETTVTEALKVMDKWA